MQVERKTRAAPIMSIQNSVMVNQLKKKEVWIGLVEVRALNGGNEILGDTKGAFVNIVTWASSAEDYKRNAETVIGDLGGLFVSDVLTPEPVKTRRVKKVVFEEEIEDMISRAEGNPNAIIYGTFHTFEKDDA
jgi:hypothetical protein